MSKLHIVGIGGTGHKLVEAVIHLTACGAFKINIGQTKIDSIRLMTIDADNANGNLSQTTKALGAYKKYFNALNADANLGLVEIETVIDSLNLSLYKDDKKSLHTAFKMNQFEDCDENEFIHFLYTKDEVAVEFDQGFYGHTSIGTLIVKHILNEHPDWHNFVQGINSNDFVFVMGSIFGGTGASAVPVVLDELNKRQKELTENKFKLAAIMLNPYFKALGEIKEAGILQPNPDSFQTKAKASLYYYKIEEQYSKTDELYILGEPEVNFSYERASRGASDQTNKPHPVELFAVTAIIDFIKKTDDRSDNKIMTASRRSSKGEYYYTWDMLQRMDSELPQKMQKLMKKAVFYNKVLYRELTSNNAASIWWANYDGEIHKDEDETGNLICKNIYEYLSLFVKWVYNAHKKILPNLIQIRIT